MIPPRMAALVAKQILRARGRTALTVSGVALAMFLFCAVQAMRGGVAAATRQSAEDTTLVVYRENRFCPFTSQLPEDHGRRIAAVPGVAEVVPMKIVVNNCRASLDVITFRGVPEESLAGLRLRLLSGSTEEWQRRSDAALVGARLAERRGLSVGDRFSSSGVTAHVAGIVDSDNPQDENVAYVHLPFLQRAAGNKAGIVTQFNVRVTDPARLASVAEAIDAELRASQAPTWTSPEKAFVARAVADIVELVDFAGWLGLGSLVAIFALVGNAITLSVQGRVKDHAVMQTLGYGEGLIVRLVVAESVGLSVMGAALGSAAAIAVSHWGRFSFSVEGMSVPVEAGAATLLAGLAISVVVGVLAGLAPAVRAARLSTAEAFRAV
ncbi:MAG: ABC transporter permease [Candidatus Sumerlaeia bacterium]|nr:ABC transporter permease [Candidatus Sumerlaeia bacterium]